MKFYLRHKYFFQKIILGVTLSYIFYGCEKIQNTYIGISSREQKLVYKSWMLQGAFKDGNLIPYSQYCAINNALHGHDVYFLKSGAIGIDCALLFPSFSKPRGTWALKNKKDIEITISDSTYYDYVNYQYVYVPVNPVKIKWEIITITRKSMRVKESRKDGEYEFSFTNDF